MEEQKITVSFLLAICKNERGKKRLVHKVDFRRLNDVISCSQHSQSPPPPPLPSRSLSGYLSYRSLFSWNLPGNGDMCQRSRKKYPEPPLVEMQLCYDQILSLLKIFFFFFFDPGMSGSLWVNDSDEKSWGQRLAKTSFYARCCHTLYCVTLFCTWQLFDDHNIYQPHLKVGITASS